MIVSNIEKMIFRFYSPEYIDRYRIPVYRSRLSFDMTMISTTPLTPIAPGLSSLPPSSPTTRFGWFVSCCLSGVSKPFGTYFCDPLGELPPVFAGFLLPGVVSTRGVVVCHPSLEGRRIQVCTVPYYILYHTVDSHRCLRFFFSRAWCRLEVLLCATLPLRYGGFRCLPYHIIYYNIPWAPTGVCGIFAPGRGVASRTCWVPPSP